MTTLLPERPSFSSLLGRGLGTGFSQGVGSSLNQAMELKKIASKQKGQSDLFSQVFSNQGNQQQGSQLSAQELTPDQETMLALTHPQEFNAYKNLKESRSKERQQVQQKENLGNVIKEMSNTLLEGNLGFTPNRLGTKKGRRDSQYFDSLGLQLESAGKELVSKGVLSQARFAYLLSNLPSSKKTDASNAGALEAWADELGVDRPEGLETLYENKSSVKKVKSGTPMTLEVMEKLYKKTGGDKEKAKQVAKKMGYVVA